MVYKYKIYLDVDKLDLTFPNTFKRFILKDNYIMNLNINLDNQDVHFDIYICQQDIVTQESKEIATIEYKYIWDTRKNDSELLKLCKTYICSSSINSDVFMIKIFSNDIMTQLDNNYNNVEMLNEIKFTDFNNNYELMDLCTLMLTRHMPDAIRDLFIQKIVYFGYKDLNDVVGTDKIYHVVDNILTEVTLCVNDIIELFCDMATIDLYNDHKFSDKFLRRVNLEYDKISDIRVKNLKADFII